MKLIRSLPASVLASLAQALQSSRLKPPYTAFSVAEWTSQITRESLAAELVALSNVGFTPAALAITFQALAEHAMAAQRAVDNIQLVWTSPDEEGPHVRDTSVVVRQLLSEARHSLWISTYGVFNGQEAFLPIHEAWSVRTNLEVVLILNVPPGEKSGIYDADAIQKYSKSFWKYQWPWAETPAVFYDPRGPEKDSLFPGCQHSKCILVDDETAFITSANFTESAHERNIELGILLRENPVLAKSIKANFESLIGHRFLKSLPRG